MESSILDMTKLQIIVTLELEQMKLSIQGQNFVIMIIQNSPSAKSPHIKKMSFHIPTQPIS